MTRFEVSWEQGFSSAISQLEPNKNMLNHLTFPTQWETGRANKYSKRCDLKKRNNNLLNYSFGVASLVRFGSSPASRGVCSQGFNSEPRPTTPGRRSLQGSRMLEPEATSHSRGYSGSTCLNSSSSACFIEACSSLHGPWRGRRHQTHWDIQAKTNSEAFSFSFSLSPLQN